MRVSSWDLRRLDHQVWLNHLRLSGVGSEAEVHRELLQGQREAGHKTQNVSDIKTHIGLTADFARNQPHLCILKRICPKSQFEFSSLKISKKINVSDHF